MGSQEEKLKLGFMWVCGWGGGFQTLVDGVEFPKGYCSCNVKTGLVGGSAGC
jgi:hypothetical protein